MTTIKNKVLIDLSNKGLFTLDYSGLDAKGGYKVLRTVTALRKAAAALEQERAAILKERVGADDMRKAQQYERATDKTAEGIITAEEYSAIMLRFVAALGLIKELLEDEVEVDARPLDFETYFTLKKANKDVLTADADVLLEGLLWQEDEE